MSRFQFEDQFKYFFRGRYDQYKVDLAKLLVMTLYKARVRFGITKIKKHFY